MYTTRSWAEIDLGALAYNMRSIRARTEKTAMVTAVIKSDAYGHGAVMAAETLLKNGADRFAVATVSEAVELRNAGITVPILILGATVAEEAEEIVRRDITPAVFTFEYAQALSAEAVRQSKTVTVHIKLDTGMSRIGYVAGADDNAVTDEIIRISRLDNVFVEGIFSHLSTADESDHAYTRAQFARFTAVCDLLEKKGVKIPVRHIANSAAIMMFPEMHLDMVRAGIVLYGYYPSEEVDKSRLAIKPVMSFKSRISYVKRPGAGRGVSYGNTFVTDEDTVVATVPVGYADGYSRIMSGKAEMLVNGEKFKVIGRICMDQCMIDVTNANNISIGDEVILFGSGGITADTVAGWLGTISYEALCMVGRRIPRVYTENGSAVGEVDILRQKRIMP